MSLNFFAMKKVSFNVRKWTVRTVVAVGALLGVSACCHTKKVVEDDNNNNNNMPPIHNLKYGPPIHALKYGPLVDNHYERLRTIIERVDEDGNVVYDTIDSPETPKEKPKLKQLIPEDE